MGADRILTMLTLGIVRFVYVKEGTNQVVTRFGKYRKSLEPGLAHFLSFWGIFGTVYSFQITDPITGRVTSTNEIDVKEIVYDYPRERVISRDNVQFDVNAVIYFRVMDPYKALFRVTDYIGSMRTLVQSILRAEIGRHDLEETYSNRSLISDALTKEADSATDDWGIKVIRLEIKEFELGTFADDLLRQKQEDIERRQRIIEAEGLKEATIRKAEGEKESQVIQAEGRRLAAEADAQAIRTRAAADADALKMKYAAEAAGYQAIAAVLAENPDIHYYLRLDNAEKVSRHLADGTATKLFLPADVGRLLGALSVVKQGFEAVDDKRPPASSPE